MNTVLYLNLEPKAADLAFADTAGWQIRAVTTPLGTKQITRLIDFWKPVGAVVGHQFTEGPIDFKAFGKLPVVCYTWDTTDLPSSVITSIHDSYATGQLGARELFTLGLKSFAYIHPAGTLNWSEDREAGFRDALAVNNCTAAVFRKNTAGLDYQKSLRSFLANLPKPCAVLAANDRVGADVLAAATTLDIAVPGEMAVLGVDDDVLLCEHTRPRLSSIRPDFVRCRELAARMLLSIIRNGRPRAGKRQLRCGPAGVTHRASTRLLTRYDSSVLAALDKIAVEAGAGLRARDVIPLFQCSRPVAEARFRKATGRSILEEINAVRLSRIQDLLSTDGVQIKAIAHFCGFTTLNALCNFFHRQTGLSPSAWRDKHLHDMV